jgi:L-fuconate dehydratase
MTNQLVDAFSFIRFDSKKWKFADLRIDIPPKSFGSDAINLHTQYSNPLALFEFKDFEAMGASFTLGEGNQMVCEAADFIVRQLDGMLVSDLILSDKGFYESLTNPKQLRWLSPNTGLPLMAAGLIVNTLIDAASKLCNLPAWEYLAKLPTDFLLNLIQLRHLSQFFNKNELKRILDQGLESVDNRCKNLYDKGLPVYFTTWIGDEAESIVKQIEYQYKKRGIRQFKLKISSDLDSDIIKIRRIKKLIPKQLIICVDANQTLKFDEATKWMSILSELDVLWLEEPFAPDNIVLFKELVAAKKNNKWSCEIVSGENCPNHYTAAALIESGINRFQSDPCRMLGLIDTVLTSCIAYIGNCKVTPHAGGSSLDEQSLHIQLFNLARICPDIDPIDSLTENVGFCSKYFLNPTVVNNGFAKTPSKSGLLVGLESSVRSKIISYKDGITWLKL